MTNIKSKLENIDKTEKKLALKKLILVEKAMKGSSPSDIMKAQEIASSFHKKKKSYVLDPMDYQKSFGYKDKPFSLSYNSLKRMSKVPVINSIIKTRKNQIADFAEPQNDKYSTGFVIRKKRRLGQKEEDNTKEDWRTIEEAQNFILKCGKSDNWNGDDFETFIRKIVDDSLTYDQLTFEVVRDFSGKPVEFFATDASTYRLSDSYDDDEYDGDKYEKINGYFPSYVQIFEGRPVSSFYPWELCWGVRNPSTNVHNNGYGVSELEELVTTVTSMLWADEYNRNFFSQGSAPKGLLQVKGDVDEKQLQAFRQEWLSMISGVDKTWKTPIVDGDIEWIDLQKNNRDMEYSSWSEYLIKIACAIFSIDPNEIGFNISNSNGGGALFEGNNEAKLKHSKDKGLYPLLKFLQRKINRYLIEPLYPGYEFVFEGLDGLSVEKEIELDIKRVSNYQTVNEIREKHGLDPVKGGDIILNPTFVQQMMMEEESKMNGEDAFDLEGGGEKENPFLLDFSGEQDNPFVKSFINQLETR